MLEIEITETRTAPKALSPPNSFGSATSNALQRSYYATSKAGTSQHLGMEEPRAGQSSSSADVSLSEVLKQLRAQASPIEELTRVVRDLQDSAVRLEARVSELEIE